MKRKNASNSRRETPSTSSSAGSLSPVYRPTCKLSSMSSAFSDFPMSGPEALSKFSNEISEYERSEILMYEEVYYLGLGSPKLNGKFSDDKGSFIGITGDHIGYRYEIVKILGKGAFGRVFECLDKKYQENVAIKITKNKPRFRRSGESEVEILNSLSESDDFNCIIQKLNFFDFRGHFCIVFELLSISLLELLGKQNYQGLSLSLTKRISVQFLLGLKMIHSVGIIHCDLKPENLLLKYPNKSSIKIIDFGSAIQQRGHHVEYVQSRFYRAPEVLLGCEYNEKIDMWSLGCILAEMFLGTPIFPASSELDLFHKLIETLGLPQNSLLAQGKLLENYYESTGNFIKNSENLSPNSRPLDLILGNSDEKFSDLIKLCLKWDPNDRISAESALNHPWVQGSKKAFVISK